MAGNMGQRWLDGDAKVAAIGINKVLTPLLGPEQVTSLVAWAELYYQIHVKGAPLTTQRAKYADMARFLVFFQATLHADHIDQWTPAVTKHFLTHLKTVPSPVTGQLYKPTTINRVLATVRHFARWVHQQRPLLAGDPFTGVKDIRTDAPDWNGLTPVQVMRLKAACEQRLKMCDRADQNPTLETAVFYCLLQTGLRESELVSLDVHQYHHRGFHQVMRHKSKRISTKVPLPADARECLDRYLTQRQAQCPVQPHEPLFMNRYGQRLRALDVGRICQRLMQQAAAHLFEAERFRFTPHQLRHTFLKKVADQHGIHFAFDMSGNVSIKEIFRYAKPSQHEIDQTVEKLFE
jgi:integrase/recombinase XerD